LLPVAATQLTNWDWYIDRAWTLYPLKDIVGKFIMTFQEYPPRQKPGSFNLGDALESLEPNN
jgi:hypothetical protein